MADKGKRVMTLEEIKKEMDEEKKRRTEETVNRWLDAQKDAYSFPPVPPGFPPRHSPLYSPDSYPRGPNIVESSSMAPRAEALPTYRPGFIGIPRTPTDFITPQDLQKFWDKTPAPIFPNTGPWYKFEGGYLLFRYGDSWENIRQREKEMAPFIEEGRARGFIDPPASFPRPGEVMIHVDKSTGRLFSFGAPLRYLEPVVNEEENEEESDSSTDSSSDDDGEGNNLDRSDTSTITEELRAVSPRHRRYRNVRRGAGRR